LELTALKYLSYSPSHKWLLHHTLPLFQSATYYY